MIANPLHVILGANGSVGQHLVSELARSSVPYRCVGRTVRPGWIQADSLDIEATKRACAGASHIHVCLGLPYVTSVWAREWPLIMQNVIEAAQANQSRLVFLDNIYMYGPPPLQNPITENHPTAPTSKKGAIRKALAEQLLTAHKEGRVKALIARAPDFYGPNAKNSVLQATVIARIKAKKDPLWLGNPDLNHSLGHVGDIARAMLLLAQTEDAYGQVWHTPTSPEPVNARSLHRMIDQTLGTSTRLKILPKAMISVMKYFVPLLKEVQEMAYQYYQPYNFSSQKFMHAFPTFQVTPYEKGIEQMAATL